MCFWNVWQRVASPEQMSETLEVTASSVFSLKTKKHGRSRTFWIGLLALVLIVVIPVFAFVTATRQHASAQTSPITSAGGQGFTNGGLTGQYFTNENLAGTPAFTRQDVRINFNWGYFLDSQSVSGSPSLPFQGGAFSVKWTGQLIAAYSETYTFSTESDDGARLFVNGQKLIDDWTPHGPTVDTGTISLSAGQKYDIELDYFQDYGGARIILSWSSPSTPQQVIEPAIGMGVNIVNTCDYCGDFLFTDAMKGARGWGSTSSPWDYTAHEDANGWPTQDAGLVILDPPTDAAGTYRLSFTGQAQAISGVASNVSVQNKQYDASTNTTTADLVLGHNSQLILAFAGTQRQPTDPLGTGITNVKLMMPTTFGGSTDYDPSTTFTDINKAFLSKFSAIRFMDFTWTNNNQQVNWSDRRLPTFASQVAGGPLGGGSWEYVIQLCNETGKDAYINVPELANDDYVTHLAQLFKYGSDANGNVYTSTQSNPAHPPLNPNLNLYIESSNEVWNYMFDQAHQNYDAAQAEIAAGNSPLNYDGETDKYALAQRRVGKRIKEISDLFRAIFGDAAMPDQNAQVRPLIEWQYGNGYEPLRFLDNYYNNADGIQHVSNPHPLSYYLWGGGGAAYSGVNNPGASTIDDIYNSGYSTATVPNSIKSDVQFVHAYGLKHDIAYEGGFQIGGDSPTDLQKQANVDPRAKNMEIQTQTLFNQAGGDLLMYYNEVSGNYGLATPSILSSNTPKAQAIDALNQTAQAAPTNGTTVTSGTTVTINSGWFGSNNSNLARTARLDFLTINPNLSASTYDLSVNMQTSNQADTIQVRVNDQVVRAVQSTQTGQDYTNVDFGSITLDPGINAISLLALPSTSTYIKSMTFTSAVTAGATYAFSNQGVNKCLDNEGSSTNGTGIWIWDCQSGNQNQGWKLTNASNGYYQLVNQASGKCLDNTNGNAANGTKLQQWDCVGNQNQAWSLTSLGNGYYQIANQATGKCVDNTAGGSSNGNLVEIWDCQAGNANQAWFATQR